MVVKDVMARDVITVKRSTTLSTLIGLFQKHNFHTFPVVNEDGTIAGIVNFENLLKVFQPYGSEISELLRPVPRLLLDDDMEEDIVLSEISSDIGKLLLVDDLMERDFIAVDEEDSILKTRSLMRMQKIKQLPVVKNGKLTGIISLFDIIIAVFKDKGVV